MIYLVWSLTIWQINEINNKNKIHIEQESSDCSGMLTWTRKQECHKIRPSKFKFFKKLQFYGQPTLILRKNDYNLFCSSERAGNTNLVNIQSFFLESRQGLSDLAFAVNWQVTNQYTMWLRLMKIQ